MNDVELDLHFEDGRRRREIHALPLLLGREADCGLVLKSWRVARHHARVLCRDHEVWVEDLGSIFGTTVNGRRVASHGPLQPEDELLIGPCLIRLRLLREPGGRSDPGSPPSDGAGGVLGEGSPGLPERSQPACVADIPGALGTARIGPSMPSESARAGEGQRAAAEGGVDIVAMSNVAMSNVPMAPDLQPAVPSAQSAAAKAGPGEPPAPDASVPAAAWKDHRRRLHEDLLRALQLRRRDISGMSDAALRAEATRVLGGLIAADPQLPDRLDRRSLLQELVDEAVGLGPLEPLLADPGVTEIMVNRHDEIFVERAGCLVRDPASFSSEQAVLGIIDRIVAPLGRRIDDSAPMVDARLRDGSRVNAVIAPVSLRGASLTIRKFPSRRLDMPDLLNVGALDESMAAFLTHSVRHRKNVLVSGGTGSGKTSLLNILSNAIPAGERIITIEDAAELRLNHRHLVSLEARPPNLEGRGRVDIRDLVRNALRMRPDRIVVGECRGGEAFDMLAAMNTGHEGSLTTLHANSPRDALGRLETMILMAGMDLPLGAVREHIVASIDLIVQLVRTADGRRLLSAIVQVTGIESGRIQLQELFLGQAGPPAVFTGCGLMPDGFDGAAALDIRLFSQRSVRQGRAALADAAQGDAPCPMSS
ncbi:ATPase, T2SS/T4P/T4SS family [uncultured Castellaniella sp.]|uniref:ATPase, T2SS/T4P/T4SS family n=1 Tax=uncultured Castellaniella sp. TaxID=647907 RepID=UPI0026333AD5|nr:ATPase, T2SS/T4P/T4SS family [uncultured Castellaniella sp.]